MPPVSLNMREKEYACSQIVLDQKKLSPDLSEKAIKLFNDKYDNNYSIKKSHDDNINNRSTSHSMSGSDSSKSTSSNVDLIPELTEEEKLKIDICFRGLKTQVFVCNSMANLYYSDSCAGGGDWELLYTGVPVVILDRGETKSRNKRRIQMILAERGTCFTLWQDIIDHLSSYTVAGDAFHTMFLSSDHRKIIGLSFDCVQASNELWSHIDRLTSCPENISLSGPGSKSSKKSTKSIVHSARLPEKSNISQPCCFQHVTNVHLTDRSRYFSLQTLLPVLPRACSLPDATSSTDL